ncbi:TolC family protein [Pyxidicoccus parkwayensis]|uniref:TolC family protein n=1 Tax=Pyxidicoccus parkwayensis TaxID=2813578 RepID=A0ABX7NSA9_9BACT|nr:TolC family protein [Pyxidicoccus parkwaysis]QSQ21762.1 TolC family protein [Pyxidicoccus parkwaysis]
MNALLLAALLSRTGFLPGLLLAQAPPGTVRQPTPAAQSTPTPPSPQVRPPPTGDTGPLPPPMQFQVSDPLLEPVPAAPVQVSSWREAMDLLRQRSTDLRTALAQVESAAGQRRIALAGLLPSLTGTVSVQYNVLDPKATAFLGGGGTPTGIGGGTGTGGTTLTPTTPPFLGLLSASVPLLDLRAFAVLHTADESQRTAKLSLAETRRQLTGALAQALVLVSARERLAEVNRVNLRTALERQAQAERRLELGAGTRLDVVRVRQDSENARTLVVTGDEQLRQARESLGLTLGTPEAVGLARGVRLEEFLLTARNDCQKLTELTSRPDLAVARSRVKVAESQITEVKRSYLPTVDLNSTAVALTVEKGFAQVPAWNIGAALVLPFWDGGVREGQLRQTRAGAEVARQSAVGLERNVSVEVAQARRAVEVAAASRDIADRERKLAEENDRLTRRSFEVGTGTSLELIQAAAALRQAELALVVREFELEQARVQAFLAEATCNW